jgi:hypothetical protein
VSITKEQLSQFEAVLKERFFTFFPEKANLQEDKRREDTVNRLSKSLAAFAITQLTGIDPSEAASYVIDAHDDNGIDAIYFDSQSSRLIFIQAKYKPDSEPDLGETIKFTKGVMDFVQEKYDIFNQKMQAILPSLLSKMNQPRISHLVVLIYLGGTLGRHSQQEIDALIQKLNPIRLGAAFDPWNGEKCFQALTDEQAFSPISANIETHHWSLIKENPRVLYGQVSAHQLAILYNQYGKKLFTRNIRNYIGSSEVNSAIESTIKNEPARLMHLNNGLTIICKNLEALSANLEKSIIHLNEFSIVNGAQTVGTIAHVSNELDLSQSPARVLLTVIESADTETDFEDRVTEARNTQNRVRVADFAAQDPTQERLRRELAISGIEYHYRPSAERPATAMASSITLEEAAIALACFSGTIDDSVVAKVNINELTDKKTEIYKKLFSDSLTGMQLYRYVTILRFLSEIANETERTSATLEIRSFYRHMRYFIFHFIKRRYSSTLDRPEQSISQSDKETLSRVFNELGEKTRELSEGFPRGYLAISRNLGNCRELARALQALQSQTP